MPSPIRATASIASTVLATVAVTATACVPVVGGVPLMGATPLKAVPSIPPGQEVGCMEALLTGTLAADPNDPSGVWLVAGGERFELGWPYEFGVRFEPEGVLVAPGGEVVAREGDEVSLGGGGVDDVFWVCTIDGRTWPPYG